MVEAMTEAGLQEADTYVSCRQNTVTHFISGSPITDLCLEEERRPGSKVAKRWWVQDGLDLVVMCRAACEVEHTKGEE